jgi:HlyD family secretion protein
VNTSVAEADVGKLTAGMDATFVVDAFPGERFRGKVRQIRNAAQTVQNVVTYDAVIDVDNPDLKLRPGMTANVNFVFANRENVLRVPNAALRFRLTSEVSAVLNLRDEPGEGRVGSDGGSGSATAAGTGPSGRRAGGRGGVDGPPDRRTVWVLAGGMPSSRSIRVGATDGTRTEVVEGPLAEGDVVITDATVTGGRKPGGFVPGAPAPRRGGGPRI